MPTPVSVGATTPNLETRKKGWKPRSWTSLPISKGENSLWSHAREARHWWWEEGLSGVESRELKTWINTWARPARRVWWVLEKLVLEFKFLGCCTRLAKGSASFEYVNIEGTSAMMNGSKLLTQAMGLQQWAVPNERKLMWMSCEPYNKGALFVLICCLRPILCMAASKLAMPTTAHFYLFICSFIYHSFVFWFPNFISKIPIFAFIYLIIIIFVIIIILFIYLFILKKILSVNNFSKFLSPNLISNFQNSNFHIYLFSHYYLCYYY